MKEEDIRKLLDPNRGLQVQVSAACDVVKKLRDSRLTKKELKKLDISNPGLYEYVMHINSLLNDANEVKTEDDMNSKPFERLYEKHINNEITKVEYEVLSRFYPKIAFFFRDYEKIKNNEQQVTNKKIKKVKQNITNEEMKVETSKEEEPWETPIDEANLYLSGRSNNEVKVINKEDELKEEFVQSRIKPALDQYRNYLESGKRDRKEIERLENNIDKNRETWEKYFDEHKDEILNEKDSKKTIKKEEKTPEVDNNKGPKLRFVPNEEKKEEKPKKVELYITPQIKISNEQQMNEVAKEGFRKRYGHTFEQVILGQIPEEELQENEKKHAELIKWEDDRIKNKSKIRNKDVEETQKAPKKSKKKEDHERKSVEKVSDKPSKKPEHPRPVMPKQKRPKEIEPVVEETPKEPEKVKEESRVRTLGEIIEYIEKDMPIERKDDKSYEELVASNVVVRDVIKKELTTGNVKYNISRVARTAFTAAITGVRKAYLKVFKLKNVETIEEMKKRVESLSEEELQVVYDTLTGSRRNTYGYMSGITDSLLEERVEGWLNAKANRLAVINEDLYGKLIDDYARIKEIDLLLAGGKLTKEDEIRLTKERVDLVKGKARQVKEFEDTNIEINKILSGGVFGFKDDKRAMTIGKGLNQVGYRDATKGEYDPEVVQNVSKLDRKIDELIKLGDDELALKALMYRERYLVQNTTFEKKWFGMVSTGPIVYDPISHPIDRRQDTFIRDAMMTAAAVTSIIGAANSIHTFLENKAAMAQNEAMYGKAQADVTESAKAIYKEKENFAEGNRSIAEAMRGFEQGTHERISGTRASGGDGLVISGPTYTASDHAFHLQEVAGLKEFQKGYNGLMDKFQAGTVDGTEFIRESFDLAKQSMSSFQGEMEEFLPMLRKYQANNDYDISGVLEPLEYFHSHPDAFNNLFEAEGTAIEQAETLLNYDWGSLVGFKSDMVTSIIAAASTITLCGELSKRQQGLGRKNLADQIKKNKLLSDRVVLAFEGKKIEKPKEEPKQKESKPEAKEQSKRKPKMIKKADPEKQKENQSIIKQVIEQGIEKAKENVSNKTGVEIKSEGKNR